MSPPAASTFVAPRVGGFEEEDGTKIAWVGGPNDFSRQDPFATDCFRPQKLKHRREFDKLIYNGLDAEKRLRVDTGVSVVEWCREVYRKLKQLGLDTVFCYVPNDNRHLTDKSAMINLLTDFGKVDEEQVLDFEQRLISGDVAWPLLDPSDSSKGTTAPTPQTGCKYDVAALRQSKYFLRGCIDTSLYQLVDPELHEDAYGPEYLMKIFQKKSGMSPDTIRALSSELGKMSLRDEPGENVATYAAKIKERAQVIYGSMHCPPDLTFLALRGIADSSCARWNSYANQTISKYDGSVRNEKDWITELPKLIRKYDSRTHANDWPGASGKIPSKESNDAKLAAMLASIHSSLSKQQDKKQDEPKDKDKHKNKNKDKGPTYDEDNPNPKKIKPAPGESHRKTFPDGVTRYWCATCGRFTISHYTSGHGVDSHDPTLIAPITEPNETGSAPPPAATGNLALDFSGLNFFDSNLVYGNLASTPAGHMAQDFPDGGHHA